MSGRAKDVAARLGGKVRVFSGEALVALPVEQAELIAAALDFYGDADNYVPEAGVFVGIRIPALDDDGERARAVKGASDVSA